MLGFAQEHGPFVMESGDDYFHENYYSWNKEANMLYIESPAGVGYSKCTDQTECVFTDELSATDNLTAILAWYEKFGEYKQHDLYVSGESYAGIYVPYVSYEIDQYNEANADNADVFKPNLQGFMVGNGVTNWHYDTSAAYIEMAYWHSLYDTELYNKIHEHNCDFGGVAMENLTARCLAYFLEFQQLVSDVNIYDIYGTCWGLGDAPQLYSNKKSFTAADYTPWAFRAPTQEEHRLTGLPPCTFGNPIIDYLNSSEVRDALHIPDSIQSWDLCKDDIDYTRGAEGSQWIYEKLQGKYRMLKFSGDTDGAVPTYGTQGWINELNWNITSAWRPYMVQGQVAGYIEEREGEFTFATVHGAGHMVPQFKRPQAYHLIFNWLQQKDI
mmetsp:Transcript_63889/g.88218  ORF Transcript_63889/g.88218 Transcript_63889/m.88218 type:complete len:384 (-) Transcript_63889:87-1238(-)